MNVNELKEKMERMYKRLGNIIDLKVPKVIIDNEMKMLQNAIDKYYEIIKPENTCIEDDISKDYCIEKNEPKFGLF